MKLSTYRTQIHVTRKHIFFFCAALLLVGLLGYVSIASDKADAQSYNDIRIHRISSIAGYPAKYLPASQGDQQGDLYIKSEAWPYSNATPTYYGSDSSDTPFFVYTLLRDGTEIASCRKDFPVHDTCRGSALTHIDYNVERGNYYTYSAYIETYERDPRCARDYPNDLTYCGPAGNSRKVGTGPIYTSSPVYVGLENRPRMTLELSHEGQQITDSAKIPSGGDLTASWSHWEGDAPDECALYKKQTANDTGSLIETSRGGGTATFNVGSELGQYYLRLSCINGYYPPGTPVTEGTSKTLSFEVVDQLPDGYYDDADPTGGGGSAVAVPIDNVTEGDDITNVFSSTSGSFVSMRVAGCSTESAGFMTYTSSRDDDNTYIYPFGIMSFTLNCDEAGSTARITKHYYTEADPAGAVLRKYNLQTNEYTNISSASIESVMHKGKRALEVSYSVTDGGALDEDGEANGVIVDPVVLGVTNPEAYRQQIEADCDGDVLTPDNCKIIFYVRVFTDALSVLVGLVVVAMIVLGGIQYSSASGNPQAVAAAKKRITNALIALVAYLFIFAFLQWIIPGGVL